MRMWLVNPKWICRQHLLGEHNELHMLVGSIENRKSIRGYLDKHLIDPLLIDSRHDELVKEMKSRKYNHKSPIYYNINDLLKIMTQDELITLNFPYEKSKQELLSRCPKCKKRYELYLRGKLED